MGRAGIASLLLLVACAAPIRLEYAPGQVKTTENRGAVVCEDYIACRIGRDVLQEGGNAVDAAVATAFALGVTWPQAGNPGGGGFAVIALPDGGTYALDFREVAPGFASRDMFLGEEGKPDPDLSLRSRLGAGVPGTVAGLHALHERFGRLSWKRVVGAAVQFADSGFPISAALADDLNAHREKFLSDEGAARIFVREDREWRENDVLAQPDLARTLAAVRDRGPAGFYEGSVAAALAEDMSARGGLVTADDLAAYRPEWREPARFAFRGHEVVTMPLPSSAGVVLARILGGFDRAGGAETGPGSIERLHIYADASARAFALRNRYLGDPAGVPAGETLRLMNPESDETTNLSVVDREGGAVAITYTLNSTFGTHLVAPGTGVIWNNEMDDFAAKPGEPNQFGLRQGARNAVVAGRRPLSSMSPTLVRKDGRVILVLGSPGGPRILSAVAQVILHHVGDGLALDLAVLAPRIHHQHRPDRIDTEDADVFWPEDRERPDLEVPDGVRRGLWKRGHTLNDRDSGIGRITAIAVDLESGRVMAVADPRCPGRPAIE